MKKKAVARLAACLLLLLVFSGCGDNGASLPPPDLTGRWEQVGSENSTFYQVVFIRENQTMEAYWYNAGRYRLYWAGSYTPPVNGAEPYSWVSINDTARTTRSNWGLRDEQKTFTYEDGKIEYQVTMGNLRMGIALERVDETAAAQ